MTGNGPASGGDGLQDLRDFWLSWLPRSAPNSLVQPILPDWSLIRITENNSSAPDTERRILEHDSYGRQIGRIMDVVALLIGERSKDAPPSEAIDDFEKLRERIAKAKCKAASDRLSHLRADLELLKADDPDAYHREVAALRNLLSD